MAESDGVVLPTPRTTTETLLVALVGEVAGLRADLRKLRLGTSADREPSAGLVELREPQAGALR